MFKLLIFTAILISLSADTYNFSKNIKPTLTKKREGTMLSKVVVVTGYGIDKESALTNAFKSAVEQFVGVVVDADTIVQNDAIIKDEILTASNGYIQKYKELSTTKENGLVEVKIRAQVKSQKVFEKIKSLNIATIKLKDYSKMYEAIKNKLTEKEQAVKNAQAQQLTQIKSKKDAEKILKKSFQSFLSANSIKEMLSLSIGKVKIYDKNITTDKKVPITVSCSIAFNQKVYEKKISQLTQTFQNLGALYKPKVDFPFIDNNKLHAKLKYRVTKLGDTDIKIVTRHNNGLKTDAWKFPDSWNTIFPFSKDVLARRPLSENFNFILEVKKINGDIVFSESISNQKLDFSPIIYKIRVLSIVPLFIHEKKIYSINKTGSAVVLVSVPGGDVVEELKMNITILLDIEDIKDLDKIDIYLEEKS